MPPFANIFYEIAALLLIAAVMGAPATGLRQPLIVAFIAVGILSGPAGLNWVHSADQVDLLAKIGITLLLFVVGLKLDLHLIHQMGRVALATGLGQVAFTSIIGYAIVIALGFTPVAALYIAVALTFSSTIIIVKLLSDKREIDALHGRIAGGFLIVQDVVVVIALSTYLILYSHPLDEWLTPWLRIFERRVPHREQADDALPGAWGNPDMVLIGLGRYGRHVAAKGL